MCTVVYLPTKNGACFASLRDESPLRPKAAIPAVVHGKYFNFLAPVDGLAGGSWVGTNEAGTVLILLNGGFSQHVRQTIYRQSRGLLVTAMLGERDALQYWQTLELIDIEPFTLILWQDEALWQLVWDGSVKHSLQHNKSQSHIWSSSTLYNPQAKEMRSRLFSNWVAGNPGISSSSLLHFFDTVKDTQNGFLVNRSPQLQTLSFTFIAASSANAVQVEYAELPERVWHSSVLPLRQTTKTTTEINQPAINS